MCRVCWQKYMGHQNQLKLVHSLLHVCRNHQLQMVVINWKHNGEDLLCQWTNQTCTEELMHKNDWQTFTVSNNIWAHLAPEIAFVHNPSCSRTWPTQAWHMLPNILGCTASLFWAKVTQGTPEAKFHSLHAQEERSHKLCSSLSWTVYVF
jgi:hypothetical protein